MSISIIIFCFNERDNIERVIRSAMEIAGFISDSWEIIVVDDGSTDGTEQVLKAYDRIKYLRHASNEGIGMALRTGYSEASNEFICAIPGDGQFDVAELKQIKPFGFESFYSFYRPVTNYNLYRKVLTKVNRVFNQFILGVNLKDVNWIKVYRKDQLVFAEPRLASSLVESEICAKLIKSGCVAIEIPSVYHMRSGGVPSGGNWKTLSKAIREVYLLFKVTRSFTTQPAEKQIRIEHDQR